MYLSGSKNPAIRDDMATGAVGLMNGPASRYDLTDVAVWAMDNGCFTDAYPGDDAYLALLDRYAEHRDRCLFATAPDVVADATATLGRSGPMFDRIRAAGYPVALVAQDGMESMTLPWDSFDWLFIGGSTEWKLSLGTIDLVRQAQGHGKRIHVGRVNSRSRYDRFTEIGCDSADGTYLAFGPDINTPKLRSWIARPSLQVPMFRLGVTP